MKKTPLITVLVVSLVLSGILFISCTNEKNKTSAQNDLTAKKEKTIGYYYEKAPYDAIRWEKFGLGKTPEVHIQGSWYELLSIANYSVDDIIKAIIKFEKREGRYLRHFSHKITKTLVDKMGFDKLYEGRMVDIKVRELDTKRLKTLKNVPLTKANFKTLERATKKVEKALEVSPYDFIQWKEFGVGETPEIHIQGKSYDLLAADNYSVDEIIGAIIKSEQDKYYYQIRFDIGLIETLVFKMGFVIPADGKIDLKVRERDTKKIKTLKNVALTNANFKVVSKKWYDDFEIAPFKEIRWEKYGIGETPEVNVQGKWVELLAVANYSVDEIIKKAGKQRNFDERLLRTLVSKMGFAKPVEGSLIDITVRELDTKKIITLKNIPLTSANLNSIIKLRTTHLVPGKPSPSFSGYTPSGKEVKIEDLRGKVVYIDVWATWCGPCIKEIPFLKEIEKEYHDKNIVFVGISTNEEEDIDKWKKFVVDNKLGGIQLIEARGMGLTSESGIMKKFNISGIPRFILIDVEGKIVNADAPRPSEPDELRPLLDKTLQK